MLASYEEEIKENLKIYCDYLLKNFKNERNGEDLAAQGYGALMFIMCYFDYDEELANWWNDEMLPKFRE